MYNPNLHFTNQHQSNQDPYCPVGQSQVMANGHTSLNMQRPPPPIGQLQPIFHDQPQPSLKQPSQAQAVYSLHPESMNSEVVLPSVMTGQCGNYSQGFFHQEAFSLTAPNLPSKAQNDQSSSTSAAPGRDSPCNARGFQTSPCRSSVENINEEATTLPSASTFQPRARSESAAVVPDAEVPESHCQEAEGSRQESEELSSQQLEASQPATTSESNSPITMTGKTVSVPLVPLKINETSSESNNASAVRKARKSVSRPASAFLQYLSWRDADLAVAAVTDYVMPEHVSRKTRRRHENITELLRRKKRKEKEKEDEKTEDGAAASSSATESSQRKSPRIVEKHLMELLLRTRREMTKKKDGKAGSGDTSTRKEEAEQKEETGGGRKDQSPSSSEESVELGTSPTGNNNFVSSEKSNANLESGEKWNRITDVIAEVCAKVSSSPLPASPSQHERNTGADVIMGENADSVTQEQSEARNSEENENPLSTIDGQVDSGHVSQQQVLGTADQAVSEEGEISLPPTPPYTANNNVEKDADNESGDSRVPSYCDGSVEELGIRSEDGESTAFCLLKGGRLAGSDPITEKTDSDRISSVRDPISGNPTKEELLNAGSEKAAQPNLANERTEGESKPEEDKRVATSTPNLIDSTSLISLRTSSPGNPDKDSPRPESTGASSESDPRDHPPPSPGNCAHLSGDKVSVNDFPIDDQRSSLATTETAADESEDTAARGILKDLDSHSRPNSVPVVSSTGVVKVKKRKLEETLCRLQFRRYSSVIVDNSNPTHHSDHLRDWLKSPEHTGQTIVGTSLADFQSADSPASSHSEPVGLLSTPGKDADNLPFSDPGLLARISKARKDRAEVHSESGLTLPVRSFSTDQECSGDSRHSGNKEKTALSILTTDISLSAIAQSVGISTEHTNIPPTSPISSPESPNQETGAEKMIAHHGEPPTLWPLSSGMQISPSDSGEAHSKLPTITAESMEHLVRNETEDTGVLTLSSGMDTPAVSTTALVYGGPIVPLIPRPARTQESRSSSLSCSPPPPLVLGAPHLAHTVSMAKSTFPASSPASSATSVISRTLTPQGRVEISIVGSPEVFGSGPAVSNAQMSMRSGSGEPNGDLPRKSPPLVTIDEDERVIERCEQLPPDQPRPHPDTPSMGSIVHGTSLNNSLCLPTTGNNPDIAMMPLSPGPQDAQETRPPSNGSKASSGSPSEEATVKRRGSFSTGSQPPPKKRFILSLDPSDERNKNQHEILSGTQVHDGRVDRGVGSDDPEIVIDDAQEPVPKKSSGRPDSTDTVAYEIRPYCPKTQDAQTSTVTTSAKQTETHVSTGSSHSAALMAPSLHRIGVTTQHDPRYPRPVLQNGPVPLQTGPPRHTHHAAIRSALENPPRLRQQWIPHPQSGRPIGHIPNAYQPAGPVGVTRPIRPVRPQAASVAQLNQHSTRMNGTLKPSPTQAQQTQAQGGTSTQGTPTVGSGDGGGNLTHYRLIQEIKQLPHGEQFQAALNNWEWVLLDSVRLPSVYRGNSEKFVAVHMVQMRLLSKFPPNVPGEIMRRHTMVSHKMTVLESWIFNTVNALQCRFEFGCQLFTTQDEVVKLTDVEKFYWAVKAFNLSRMSEIYRTEIRGTAQLHLVLTAHISSLKSHAEQELRDVQQVIAAGSATTVPVLSSSPVRSSSRVQHSPVQGPVTMSHNTAAAMAAQSALLSSHYAQAAVARVSAGQNVSLLSQHSNPQVVSGSHAHQLYPSPLSGETMTHAGHNPHLLAAAYAAAATGQYPTAVSQSLLHSPPSAGHHHHHHHHQLQPHHASAASMISPQLRLPYGAGLGGKPAAAAVPHVYR